MNLILDLRRSHQTRSHGYDTETKKRSRAMTTGSGHHFNRSQTLGFLIGFGHFDLRFSRFSLVLALLLWSKSPTPQPNSASPDMIMNHECFQWSRSTHHKPEAMTWTGPGHVHGTHASSHYSATSLHSTHHHSSVINAPMIA